MDSEAGHRGKVYRFYYISSSTNIAGICWVKAGEQVSKGNRGSTGTCLVAETEQVSSEWDVGYVKTFL